APLLLPFKQFRGKRVAPRVLCAQPHGPISARNGQRTAALVQVTTTNAVYTGLAVNDAHTRLYAADNAGGHINVFDSTFAPLNLGAGAFANPFPGLVPFNVQSIGGDIYVTYALPGRPADIAAPEGSGGVAV